MHVITLTCKYEKDRILKNRRLKMSAICTPYWSPLQLTFWLGAFCCKLGKPEWIWCRSGIQGPNNSPWDTPTQSLLPLWDIILAVWQKSTPLVSEIFVTLDKCEHTDANWTKGQCNWKIIILLWTSSATSMFPNGIFTCYREIQPYASNSWILTKVMHWIE